MLNVALRMGTIRVGALHRNLPPMPLPIGTDVRRAMRRRCEIRQNPHSEHLGAWSHYTVRAGSGCLAATDDLIVFLRTVPMPALVSLALEACDDVSDAELLPLLRKVHSTQ